MLNNLKNSQNVVTYIIYAKKTRVPQPLKKKYTGENYVYITISYWDGYKN